MKTVIDEADADFFSVLSRRSATISAMMLGAISSGFSAPMFSPDGARNVASFF